MSFTPEERDRETRRNEAINSLRDAVAEYCAACKLERSDTQDVIWDTYRTLDQAVREKRGH